VTDETDYCWLADKSKTNLKNSCRMISMKAVGEISSGISSFEARRCAVPRERRLADQWARPDAKQQRLELIETPGPEFIAPLALDVAKNLVDLRVCGVPAFR
jgi:hypothetical protein